MRRIETALAQPPTTVTADVTMAKQPVHTYIWKVQSRCNLNCSYCFVYNRSDNQWQHQPKFMTKETAERACWQIYEHCRRHNKKDVSIIFHGGEPLLGGQNHITLLITIIERVLTRQGIHTKIGIQSNGLLLTPQLCELFLKKGIRVGISIDGPPKINDVHRVDRRGRGSSARLEQKLDWLFRSDYGEVFGGFLCVINVESNPVEVFDYLASFPNASIDFILPYDNYDRIPVGKIGLGGPTPYADWLIAVFDRWIQTKSQNRIRMFDSILRLIFGGSSLVESLGEDPTDIVVIETNGDIEAVDSLKATFNGATQLGLNIFDNTFDELQARIGEKLNKNNQSIFCDQCANCSVKNICGGGYLPHRYSIKNGFNNPSIFCQDLYKTINHIYDYTKSRL